MNLGDEKAFFDLELMEKEICDFARANGLVNTLSALPFAKKAHEGQYRKNSDTPYFYHPVNLAYHCLMLDINEDEVLAAAILHDVVEDCGVDFDQLPVNDGVKDIVRLVTKEEGYNNRKYYQDISENARAALIKCLDCCNNLTTMSWGFTREGQIYYIKETEKYIMPLLETVKTVKEYEKAAWLLEYQLKAMLDIYKHMIQEDL